MEYLTDREGLLMVTEWDMSINDLLAEQAAGRSVLRSPHVGNMSPHNMALLAAGIPAWLVDYVPAATDYNYRTETVMEAGESRVIARAGGRLACRTTVEDGSATWLDEYHNAALARALPGARFETNTEYLRRHESVAAEIAGLISVEFPEVFDRLVSEDGLASKLYGSGSDIAEKISSAGIMQLNDDPRSGEAVVMTNAASLLATFVIEALESGEAAQFHISGSAFYIYAYKNNLPENMNAMYQTLRSRASFGPKLPELLKVVIVPAADAVLATTHERRAALDKLAGQGAEYFSAAASLEADRRDFFGANMARADSDKAAFLRELKTRKAAINDLAAGFVELVADCPEVIADRASRPFVTQYDVIKEGGLYVAEANRSLTMRQLAALQKRLRNSDGA